MRWSYQEEVRPNVQVGHKSTNVEMATDCVLLSLGQTMCIDPAQSLQLHSEKYV